MEKLSSYLRRQHKLLLFYRVIRLGQLSWIVASLSLFFFAGVFYFAEYFTPLPKTLSDALPVVLCLIAALVFLTGWFRSRKEMFRETAQEIERQSVYFDFHPETKTEFVAAASFLKTKSPSEFETAHISRWEKKLSQLPQLILPRASLGVWIIGAFFTYFTVVSSLRIFEHRYPPQGLAWIPTQFEALLPIEGRSWEPKTGSLTGVAGTQLRFPAPDLGLWQSYLFVLKKDGRWERSPCHRFCETTILSQTRYSVGSLWARSAEFPMQLLEDEEPRARIFVRKGNDLLPHPQMNIINPTKLELELLASDDFGIRDIELFRRFEGTEESLFSEESVGRNFRKDFLLSVDDWEGGTHEIVLRVSDQLRSLESNPLVIQYADDEYIREQRILSLRSYLDEWVHILADLVETEVDRKTAAGLEARLQNLAAPATYDHALFEVWVVEMTSLQSRIERQIVKLQIFPELPSLIQDLERQILYGLSLLFQERAGDVNAAKEAVKSTQDDLAKLLDRIRSGEQDLSSDLLKDAFSRLTQQLEDLQNRLKNLPQGPQDRQVNREALDEQLSQSEELEDRIAEIQDMIAKGEDAEALRELESLLNQLSILNQEIEKSLDQWEENLADGAMQSSQKLEKDLQALSKQQEDLLRQTEEWRKEGEEINEKFLSEENVDAEALKLALENWQKEGEDLASDQEKLMEQYNQMSRNFEEALKDTEWESVFRGSQQQELDRRIKKQMEESVEALDRSEPFEAVQSEQLTLELIQQAQEGQQQIRQQVQEQAQSIGQAERGSSKIDIVESEGRGQRERRQKIMNSLRQEVDEKFQESKDRYFEELLQR
jgi:hypothetical protein